MESPTGTVATRFSNKMPSSHPWVQSCNHLSKICVRELSLGIAETFPLSRDKFKTKHRWHIQMLALKKQTSSQAGAMQQLFPLCSRVPHSNRKQIGLILGGGKSPKQEGNSPGCIHTGVTYPTVWSPSAPCSNRQALGQPGPLWRTVKGGFSG